MNPRELIENINAHSLEELAPYENQYVAWSEAGKRILAHAADEAELYREIDRRRITNYIIGFIPPFDESYLGAGGML